MLIIGRYLQWHGGAINVKMDPLKQELRITQAYNV